MVCENGNLARTRALKGRREKFGSTKSIARADNDKIDQKIDKGSTKRLIDGNPDFCSGQRQGQRRDDAMRKLIGHRGKLAEMKTPMLMTLVTMR